MTRPTVAIIGAGPAGLTAALELIRTGGFKVIVFEADDIVGGLSRTVNHKGNRIDIGGHRFFSKSDWVMDWWREILPPEPAMNGSLPGPSMMVRNRLSRIYFEGNFFAYPLKAGPETARKLGFLRVARMLASYARARALPRRPETSLEDFLINRFGRMLYETFFREYTEKVWGVPCSEISPEWGGQRIKGLSVTKAALHALKAPFRRVGGVAQKGTSTSLIEQFLYPCLGPGQMWETVADAVRAGGGEIRLRRPVVGIRHEASQVTAVTVRDPESGDEQVVAADHVISTMPVADLLAGFDPLPPSEVRDVGAGLRYRDFMTIGLLLRKLRRTAGSAPDSAINLVPDNWIYIQDRGVKVGRLQVFNNWSPHMVSDPDTAWIGMEYFCQEGDDLWASSDADLAKLGADELARIGLADPEDVLDSVVIRMPKAYPAYFGTYDRFATIRDYTDGFDNLYLVGRNGMHRYNNQDHSMLTAQFAVNAITGGETDKAAIWNVNIDDDYHEEKSA